MNRVADVGILLTTGNRSKAYIQRLVQEGLVPTTVLLLDGKKACADEKNQMTGTQPFKIDEMVRETLENNDIPFKEIPVDDANDPKVISAIKEADSKYFIYCGGGILKKDILGLGKRFIHVHPGWIPDYKGSTCFYYSIINEGNVGVTSFIMTEKVDSGDIILQRRFPKPSGIDIDQVFDPHVRSLVLIETIKAFIKDGRFKTTPQDPKAGETYFIIHPVLKHLSILSCGKPKSPNASA